MLAYAARVILFIVIADLGNAARKFEIEVTPARVLIDESVNIQVKGLRPHERVRLDASTKDAAGQGWISTADFRANARGVVDVSRQAPVAGSYRQISAMGLVWSMMPATKNVTRFERRKDLAPVRVDVSLLRNEQRAAVSQFEIYSVFETVRRVAVRDGELRGMLFLPGSEGPHPGVLILSGSDGGLWPEAAAWLASRGFAALALAYFRYEDLPERLEAIPLEYFDRALSWMANRSEISRDRIGVMGASRGGELALQVGSMFPRIRAVVAYVPSHVRWGACCGGNSVPHAWTWQGQPLPHMTSSPPTNVPLPGDVQAETEKGIRRGVFYFVVTHFPEIAKHAAIPVERTRGPILMISGGDDRLWPSSEMADFIVKRLKDHAFKYDVQHLLYAGAGHGAGFPVMAPTWRRPMPHPVSGRVIDIGGSPEGDALSQMDAMRKVLGFLQRSLR